MRTRVTISIALPLLVLGGALGVTSCGGGDFDPASLVSGVRILASSATEPYAKPGDSVTVNLLAYDGRADAGALEPMKVSWLPIVCENPAEDTYYGCFAAFGGNEGNDAGASSGDAGVAFGSIPTGTDLTPYLPSGTSYTFQMPSDAITSHVTPEGDPYGIVFLFNAACAGHLELMSLPAGASAQEIPLGCYDANHNLVGPDDYVFGFTRVYAYADRTNANPVIGNVVFNGANVDPKVGVTVAICPSGNNCTEPSIDTVVPSSSDELDPGDVAPDGTVRHEQIWVAYFATAGKFDSDIRVLYDAVQGPVSGSLTHFQTPEVAGDGTIWAIVHDNRGGAAWLAIPMHAQ